MSAASLVDVLAHLGDPRVVDKDALLSRAADACVTDVVHAGTDPRAPEPRVTHARVRVHRAPGLHPLFVDARALDAQLDALDALAGEPGVVALGECGLDGRRGAPPLDVQERALDGALAIARRRGLPVIFHVVSSWQRFLDVMARHDDVAGVVHGFSGAREIARALVTRGLYISFGGLVTKANARRAQESARVVAIDRLVVESDTPDHPLSGARASEPADLPSTIAALAALRGEDEGILARATAENARRLFGLAHLAPSSAP